MIIVNYSREKIITKEIALAASRKDDEGFQKKFFSDYGLVVPEKQWFGQSKMIPFFQNIQTETCVVPRADFLYYMGINPLIQTWHAPQSYLKYFLNMCRDNQLSPRQLLGYGIEDLPKSNHFFTVFVLLSITLGKSRHVLGELYKLMNVGEAILGTDSFDIDSERKANLRVANPVVFAELEDSRTYFCHKVKLIRESKNSKKIRNNTKKSSLMNLDQLLKKVPKIESDEEEENDEYGDFDNLENDRHVGFLMSHERTLEMIRRINNTSSEELISKFLLLIRDEASKILISRALEKRLDKNGANYFQEFFADYSRKPIDYDWLEENEGDNHGIPAENRSRNNFAKEPSQPNKSKYSFEKNNRIPTEFYRDCGSSIGPKEPKTFSEFVFENQDGSVSYVRHPVGPWSDDQYETQYVNKIKLKKESPCDSSLGYNSQGNTPCNSSQSYNEDLFKKYNLQDSTPYNFSQTYSSNPFQEYRGSENISENGFSNLNQSLCPRNQASFSNLGPTDPDQLLSNSNKQLISQVDGYEYYRSTGDVSKSFKSGDSELLQNLLTNSEPSFKTERVSVTRKKIQKGTGNTRNRESPEGNK